MSLIAGRGCRWPPRRDSVSPCAPLSGGRDTHDGHENSPILVFFSNLLDVSSPAVEESLGQVLRQLQSGGQQCRGQTHAPGDSGLATRVPCGQAD